MDGVDNQCKLKNSLVQQVPLLKLSELFAGVINTTPTTSLMRRETYYVDTYQSITIALIKVSDVTNFPNSLEVEHKDAYATRIQKANMVYSITVPL